MKPSEIKLIVQEKYGKIASSHGEDADAGGCSCNCCGPELYSTFNESYEHLQGYNPDADLSLGCGIPVDHAAIKEGDHVLDLGCGAGNDCFVARSLTGPAGYVTGLDFTKPMLLKAEENRKKLGYENIHFVDGDIEAMPLPENSYDVVISNCVINLVPDKSRAYNEIFRVLKPGGHFCISDVVIRGTLNDQLRSDMEAYAGCVSGAMEYYEYFQIIREAGFRDILINKEKRIEVPDHLSPLPSGEENAGIFSITISARKAVPGE
jgi:SAM-dependent methyltransferase